MKILLLTVHFRPNVGGVETHLDDLCKVLAKKGFCISVLTYRPLQTKVAWRILEKGNNIEIIRIPWITGLFYKLVGWPILEFLYLLPGLLLFTPFVILAFNPKVIHAHGLVAGFVAVFWGKIFGKKIIISTHSIYHFPEYGLYREFVKWIFNNADINMGLSDQAVDEIKSLGISSEKVRKFTYWIDLDNFKQVSHAKKSLEWDEKFTVLFIGRLVSEKGIEKLLESAKSWDKGINLKIIGIGPLDKFVQSVARRQKNVEFIGSVSQSKLPIYYSGSDILIVPSMSEEGFGRVILESLACGTPIIGAKRGAISEAMDDTVGKLIEVSAENIRQTVNYFYTHKKILLELAKNCRKFTERRYFEKNADTIIKAYQI